MSWASGNVTNAQQEYDEAVDALDQLRQRGADAGAVSLAEYRLHSASRRLTRSVTGGDDAA